MILWNITIKRMNNLIYKSYFRKYLNKYFLINILYIMKIDSFEFINKYSCNNKYVFCFVVAFDEFTPDYFGPDKKSIDMNKAKEEIKKYIETHDSFLYLENDDEEEDVQLIKESNCMRLIEVIEGIVSVYIDNNQ